MAISELEAQQLRSVVESLPPEQRKAIELAYFQGLTFQQVATATGSAEGTAKSRLRLGLSRLAVALEREMVLEWT